MFHNEIPLDALAKDKIASTTQLAELLSQGSLALFLGAGASSGMGLPDWNRLVSDCVAATGVDCKVEPGANSEALMRVMSVVERETKSDYKEVVRTALYSMVKDEDLLLQQKLLAVIGALTMPSRRGSISEVVTFNFDDILERFLAFHGFRAQVVHSLPAVAWDCDVTVYHPHGFLPRSAPLSSYPSEIVFSQTSFERRLGEVTNAWNDQLRRVISNRVGLFVGLSDRTVTLNTVLTDLGAECMDSRGVTGYWLVSPSDDKYTEAGLIDKGIVPLKMSNYEEYYEFLFGVCQAAAVGRGGS